MYSRGNDCACVFGESVVYFHSINNATGIVSKFSFHYDHTGHDVLASYVAPYSSSFWKPSQRSVSQVAVSNVFLSNILQLFNKILLDKLTKLLIWLSRRVCCIRQTHTLVIRLVVLHVR